MPIELINKNNSGAFTLINKTNSGKMSFDMASVSSALILPVTSGLVLNLNTSDPASYPGSGTTWYDTSGNGYNATMNGTVPYTAASSGYFTYSNTNIRFDGNNSLASKFGTSITIISIASITDLSKRSVLFSKYKTSSTYGYIFEIGTASGAWTNTLRYYAAGSTITNVDLRGTTTISANTNYMFSLVHDVPAVTTQLYLNNSSFPANFAANNIASNATNVFNTSNNYIIGSYQPYFAIYSAMNQYTVFVYNRALSSAEISTMYDYLKPIYNIS